MKGRCTPTDLVEVGFELCQRRQVVHVGQLSQSARVHTQQDKAGEPFEQTIREVLLGAQDCRIIKVDLQKPALARKQPRGESG